MLLASGVSILSIGIAAAVTYLTGPSPAWLAVGAAAAIVAGLCLVLLA